MSQFCNPVPLYFGREGVGQLASALESGAAGVDTDRVLLLTRGGGVEGSPGLRPLMAALQGKDVRLKELQLANPDLSDVMRLKEETDDYAYQLVVAVGGGSVMDMAKALAALRGQTYSSAAELRAAIASEQYRRLPGCFTPWIGVPTTSGTGSEVTSWATVWDEQQGSKYSISDERLYAAGAVILPELTVMKPLRLSAATALDALSHATEAYWSVRTNPVTRHYALQAIERIRTALPKLKDEPGNSDIRMQLALGSLYAGLAFSNTKTTACHSISYPLTLLHGIEHGIAASLTLGRVLLLNREALAEPDKLLAAYGAGSLEDVGAVIEELYRAYGIPSRLRDYGVTSAHIPAIVERAYTKGRMDNNPVEITEELLRDLLESMI